MATKPIGVRRGPLGVHEIARRTQLSPAHISKIFSGQRLPSLGNAALIASAMKISLDDLYRRLVDIQEGIAKHNPAYSKPAHAASSSGTGAAA